MRQLLRYSVWPISICLASPLIIEGPSDVETVEESDAEFSCSATGEPLPTIQWYFMDILLSDSPKYTITNDQSELVSRNGSGIEYSSGSGSDVQSDIATISALRVSNVSQSDSGSYTCLAVNDHGNDSATAELLFLSKSDE